MNKEFPNVFMIEGEELIYQTLDDAKAQCGNWQTIIEYKAVFTYTPENIRQYKVEAVFP